jgi:serpin B
MVIVLPAPGSSIAQLEQELATQPDALDVALKKRVGRVTMPAFHMIYSADLGESIKALGVTTPFKNLVGMISIQGSHLTQVVQTVDIQVDKEGIRANSETVSGMVYGGILAANDPFHMVVDRPFLFLIRDQTTNALLFIGALMDPEGGATSTQK